MNKLQHVSGWGSIYGGVPVCGGRGQGQGSLYGGTVRARAS